jgi:hypothetical protein
MAPGAGSDGSWRSQWLLGVVAIGFLAFGAFLVTSARHRQIAC